MVRKRTASRGRTRRRESGQAMPLAAVGLLVMVLGILATLNLGQAVHEKIRLQNTADSAAYSLAAMEARTFNYIAFLNRAQLAHYNTAMVVQSYLTWTGFHLAQFGATVDLLSTLRNVVAVGAKITPPCWLNGPRCLFQTLLGTMTPIVSALEQVRDRVFDMRERVDKLGHQIVQAMSIFNDHAVWQSQLARAALLNGHLLTGMQSHISRLDPELAFTKGKAAQLNTFVNIAMNSIEYYNTFDNASGVNPFLYGLLRDLKRVRPGGAYKDPGKLDPAAQQAYRLMTELCHATRSPQFVSNRRAVMTPVLLPAAGLWNPILSGAKLGQTKLTQGHSMGGAEIRAIRSEGNYALGTGLSSDDFVKLGQGGALAILGHAVATVSYTARSRLGDAVAAYDKGIDHYLYQGPSQTSSVMLSPGGQGVITSLPVGPPRSTAGKTSHPRTTYGNWPGFAPYFKFKPVADRTRDYNQPSTWIFLNKHHEDFQTDAPPGAGSSRAPWYENFSWQNGQQVARLNTAVGSSRNSVLFEGITVVSRGMVYYHRPGHWKEHPNFFNPFWRARLAPVGQRLQSFWDRYVTSNITSSAESKVIQGMVAFLRKAQMDLFTSAISSVITH